MKKRRNPFRFDILTIFPDLIEGYLRESIVKREILKKTIAVRVHDIRKFSKNKHKKVDDIPYGGGAGMLMTPQPIYDCISYVRKLNPKLSKRQRTQRPVIYLTPQGRKFSYRVAKELSAKKGLILLCGRYEGIDQRIRDLCVDDEISIGDYVLTGGELPALTVLDAVTRLIPGALGDKRSAEEDSFTEALGGKKEYPHYTRPPIFRKRKVPDVLMSGNHAKIALWRSERLQ